MKAILVFWSLTVWSICLFGAEIHSTSSGGDWNSPSTWIGGLVPGGTDSAFIHGPVMVTPSAACYGLYVLSTGVLRNVSGLNTTLTINDEMNIQGSVANSLGTGVLDIYLYGHLFVYGTLANRTSGNLYLRCRKNLHNYGAISCYQVGLGVIGDQYCRISGSVFPNRFTLYSNIGPAAWYFNGFWQSEGADHKDVPPYVPGVWQSVSSVSGRFITLDTSGATILGIPQNVSAMG